MEKDRAFEDPATGIMPWAPQRLSTRDIITLPFTSLVLGLSVVTRPLFVVLSYLPFMHRLLSLHTAVIARLLALILGVSWTTSWSKPNVATDDVLRSANGKHVISVANDAGFRSLLAAVIALPVNIVISPHAAVLTVPISARITAERAKISVLPFHAAFAARHPVFKRFVCFRAPTTFDAIATSRTRALALPEGAMTTGEGVLKFLPIVPPGDVILLALAPRGSEIAVAATHHSYDDREEARTRLIGMLADPSPRASRLRGVLVPLSVDVRRSLDYRKVLEQRKKA